MKGFGVLAFVSLAAALPAPGAKAQTAADAYYDPSEMAKARHMLRMHHGGGATYFLEAERLEYQSGDGDPLFLWDAQGWYGTDRDKLWLKTEGAAFFDGGLEHGEAQALYSRAIGGYFDLQGGVRRDFGEGLSRTHAVIGVQGLAPYLFEVDAAVFVSGHGDLTARIEVEYELLLTQRLILQPRAEMAFAAQEIAELGVGAGLSSADVGARLRYEIKREFAPYVGVSWSRDVGDTADFTRAAGEDPATLSLVAGVRMWF